MFVCACVRACVRACVCVCARARACVCVCACVRDPHTNSDLDTVVHTNIVRVCEYTQYKDKAEKHMIIMFNPILDTSAK